MIIPFEIKSMDDEAGTFIAYGATFGNEDLGGDVVVKGAFKKSLEDTPAEKVYMFYNHDNTKIIGEYTSIVEDDHGLLIEGKLYVDNIALAKETHFLMKKGKIKKFSIGFQTIKKAFSQGRRMLQELKLVEISPVTFPMNTEADLLLIKNNEGTKMTIEEIESLKSLSDIEDALRDNGFSKKAATGLVAKVAEFKKVSDEGEPQKKEDEKKESDSLKADSKEDEQKKADEALKVQEEADDLKALKATFETLNEIKG